MRSVSRYEPRASVRTYLYGIALKLVLAERRRPKTHSLGKDVNEPAAKEEIEPGLFVRDALEMLETTEREILMLREYEQLSYEEIGALLGVPVNTVRSRLFRARMALKRQLEPVLAGRVRREEESCS